MTIAWSTIHTGDDDVSIKSDATGAASNMSILHNRFYTGHGMSIGSQTAGGVDHILVRDLTIDGADNGLRIKSDRSRGGLVENVAFEDVCIRNSPNPLVFTPMYTTFAGEKLPPVSRHRSARCACADAGRFHLLWPGRATQAWYRAERRDRRRPGEIRSPRQVRGDLPCRQARQPDPSWAGRNRDRSRWRRRNYPALRSRFVPLPTGATAPQAAVKVLPEDKTLYVAADGTGDYWSIQRAIDVAPATGGALILVAPGTYREVLTISKPEHPTAQR